MPTDIYYRVFVYSRAQYDQRVALDRKMGRTTKLGTVLVNGIPKHYTDILTSMANCKYSDAIKIIEGDIRKIHYTAGNIGSLG